MVLDFTTMFPSGDSVDFMILERDQAEPLLALKPHKFTSPMRSSITPSVAPHLFAQQRAHYENLGTHACGHSLAFEDRTATASMSALSGLSLALAPSARNR
jgi:hypothetical protein